MDIAAERPSPEGTKVFAISDVTAIAAARDLAKSIPTSHWRRGGGSPVRAGEHLAAITIDTYLRCGPPCKVDASGEVDFTFMPLDQSRLGIPASVPVSFEVKSLPGDLARRGPSDGIRDVREWNTKLDRALTDGDVPRKLRSIGSVLRSVNELFDTARPQVDAATDALLSKTPAFHSRNVFLLVHPFNFTAVEFGEPVLSHLLPDPEVTGIDTLWVQIHPMYAAVWSASASEWTELMFGTVEGRAGTPLDTLQEAEGVFLDAAGFDGSSPWSYQINSRA